MIAIIPEWVIGMPRNTDRHRLESAKRGGVPHRFTSSLSRRPLRFPLSLARRRRGTYISFATSVLLFSMSSIYITKKRTTSVRGNRIDARGASEGSCHSGGASASHGRTASAPLLEAEGDDGVDVGGAASGGGAGDGCYYDEQRDDAHEDQRIAGAALCPAREDAIQR